MSTVHHRLILQMIEALQGDPKLRRLGPLADRLGLEECALGQALEAWFALPLADPLPYLAPGFAPDRLADRGTLFDTAQDARPRMPALQISWEETAAHGASPLTIRSGMAPTPFGPAIGLASEEGLIALGFAALTGPDACRDDLARRWPDAAARADPKPVASMIEAAIHGEGRLHVMGSPFQLRVWRALHALHTGELLRYGALAEQIGSPGSAQAVGNAVGQNPLSWVLPCHLVLPARAALGGYHWGAPIKGAMLAREIAWADAGRAL